MSSRGGAPVLKPLVERQRAPFGRDGRARLPSAPRKPRSSQCGRYPTTHRRPEGPGAKPCSSLQKQAARLRQRLYGQSSQRVSTLVSRLAANQIERHLRLERTLMLTRLTGSIRPLSLPTRAPSTAARKLMSTASLMAVPCEPFCRKATSRCWAAPAATGCSSQAAVAGGAAAPCDERPGRTTSIVPAQRRRPRLRTRTATMPSTIPGEAAQPVGRPVRSVVPLLLAISTAGSWARLVGMLEALPQARQQIQQIAQRRGHHEQDDAKEQQPGASPLPPLLFSLPGGSGR